MIKKYTLDPRTIGMDQFLALSASKKLLPGRLLLKDRMEERFATISNAGIENLGALLSAFNSRKKIVLFAKTHQVPVEYLVLVRREAGSYLVRPFLLSEFPGIPFEFCEVLKSIGLGNTREFFETIQAKNKLDTISEKAGIPKARLREIYGLCDLSRIGGVGPVFARIAYEAGFRSPTEFASNDASTICFRCNEIIEKRGFSASRLTEVDAQYCIDFARVMINVTG